MADQGRKNYIVRGNAHTHRPGIMPPVMGPRGVVTIRGTPMQSIVARPFMEVVMMAAIGSMFVDVGRTSRPAVATGMVGRGMIAVVAAFETAAVTPAVGPGISTDEKNRCNRRYHPLDRSFFHDSPLACCVPRPMMSNHCGTVWLV